MFWKKFSAGNALTTFSCPSSEEGMIDAKSGCRDAVCEPCDVSAAVVVVVGESLMVGISSGVGEMRTLSATV